MNTKLIDEPTTLTPEEIDISKIDISSTVGHKITLFSDQFAGQSLISRIVVATGNTISLDRSGGFGLVDNLVNNQKVIVKLDYKGEEIAILGTLKRVNRGGCKVQFDDKVQPLFRRRYPRAFLHCPINLAAVPIQSFSSSRLSKLRWMITNTVNLSGGGALLDFSSYLESTTYLFMNIDFKEILFPSLLLGQVCHCQQMEDGHFHIGVEFIPREEQERHFSTTVVRQLPTALATYDDVQRFLLSKKIVAWMQNRNQ